jgi:hypothetical protein
MRIDTVTENGKPVPPVTVDEALAEDYTAEQAHRATEAARQADTVEPMTAATTPSLAQWTSPGIAYLDTLTSDGRALTGEIDWRPPPLPLMFQPASAHGSVPTMQSVMAGGIDQLSIEDKAITASGSLDDSEHGAAAAAALATGRFGVSIDLAVHDWEEVYNKDMFAGLEELFASASGSTSLSLGARDESWDGGSSMQPDDFSKGYFWTDPAGDAATKAAYKLPFASRSGGTLHAVWNGVTAAAAAIQGARGGVSIPDGDVAGVKAKIEAYYTKAATEYQDDTITPPWASDSQTASVSQDAGIAGEGDVVESYSIEDALFVVTKGTIMGATISPFVAFDKATISLVSSADKIIRISQPQVISLVYQPRGVSSDMLAAVAALEESVAMDRIPTLAAAVQAGVMTASEARGQLGLSQDVPAPTRGEETSDVTRLLESVKESAADRERALTTLTETVSKMQRNGGSVTFIRDEQGRITGAERS